MEIVSHEKPFREIKYVADEPMELGYVVKGARFEVQLKLRKPLTFNFKTGNLSYALCIVKERTSIIFTPPAPPTCAPIEVFSQANSCDPSHCVLVCRLNVLSSRHDHASFSLRIRLTDPHGTDYVEAFTDAMFVCSNVAQINQRRHDASLEVAKQLNKKKRTRFDDVIDQLADVERAQAKQTRLLESIVRTPQQSFESALNSLVSAYNTLAENERPAKVRRLLTTLPEARRMFSELAGCVQQEPSPEPRPNWISWEDPELVALLDTYMNE